MIRYVIEEDIRFVLKSRRKRSDWVRRVIYRFSSSSGCGEIIGEITFVFCSDDSLRKVNRKFLKHDYYTDVITFNYCDGEVVSGDILVSVDRVRENARDYNALFDDELSRVMIHGVLHLLEYSDQSKRECSLMREREDESLKMREW